MERKRVDVPFVVAVVVFDIDHYDLVGPKCFDGVFFIYLNQIILVIHNDRSIESILINGYNVAWIPVFKVFDAVLGYPIAK